MVVVMLPKVVEREEEMERIMTVNFLVFPTSADFQRLLNVDVFPSGSEGLSWAFREWVTQLQILDVFIAEEK